MALFRFGEMDDIFGQMDRMMNQMMGGMGMFHHDPFSMVPFGMRPQQPPMARNPFPGFPNMMTMMQSTSNMNNPGTFVSSSFMSYSSDGRNPPQVYEQTHMNRVGPGGVREERRTVRDSRSGLQQMSIGRHIQDRGHVMERKKNHHTGEEEENNEYINIEEEEADQFNNEFNSHMARSSTSGHNSHRYIQQAPQRREPVLAITGPEGAINPSSPAASSSSSSESRNVNKRLRIKPTSMKKEKKAKKPYHKE